jgi:hypothetical protein
MIKKLGLIDQTYCLGHEIRITYYKENHEAHFFEKKKGRMIKILKNKCKQMMSIFVNFLNP